MNYYLLVYFYLLVRELELNSNNTVYQNWGLRAGKASGVFILKSALCLKPHHQLWHFCLKTQSFCVSSSAPTTWDVGWTLIRDSGDVLCGNVFATVFSVVSDWSPTSNTTLRQYVGVFARTLLCMWSHWWWCGVIKQNHHRLTWEESQNVVSALT